jgi:hypothetical protein
VLPCWTRAAALLPRVVSAGWPTVFWGAGMNRMGVFLSEIYRRGKAAVRAFLRCEAPFAATANHGEPGAPGGANMRSWMRYCHLTGYRRVFRGQQRAALVVPFSSSPGTCTGNTCQRTATAIAIWEIGDGILTNGAAMLPLSRGTPRDCLAVTAPSVKQGSTRKTAW